MKILMLIKAHQNYKDVKALGMYQTLTSTKMMLHLIKLPSIQEPAYILQSQFLLPSFTLPDDIYFIAY
jgi:hypothetical protein